MTNSISENIQAHCRARNIPGCGIQAQRGVETLLKAGHVAAGLLGHKPCLSFITLREGRCFAGWDSWGPLQPGLATPLKVALVELCDPAACTPYKSS